MQRVQPGGFILPDPVASTVASNESKTRPPFLLPADGMITSGYGWRRDPLTGRRRFHSGIDIANLSNSVVCAAAGGVVRFAGRMSACGRVVVIDHGDDVVTRSCHLRRTIVRPGDRVGPREPIGYMGATGRATGSHLHFEIRRNRRPVDPTALLMF